MTVKLSVGLSRKVGEANFGSRGASVNLELEVEAVLADEPTRLHERIRQLFALARSAVAEELDGGANSTLPSAGNGPISAPVKVGDLRPATAPQVRTIYALARRLDINLGQWLQERCGVRGPEQLNIRQASRVIDELKKPEEERGS